MSCKGLIYTTNSGTNSVTEGNVIPLGNVVRRFGRYLSQSGSGIVAEGDGYYQIVANVTFVPSAVGVVGISLLNNGDTVAVSQCYADTANEPVNLTIVGVIRNSCCNDRSFIELQLSNGNGNVSYCYTDVIKM